MHLHISHTAAVSHTACDTIVSRLNVCVSKLIIYILHTANCGTVGHVSHMGLIEPAQLAFGLTVVYLLTYLLTYLRCFNRSKAKHVYSLGILTINVHEVALIS